MDLHRSSWVPQAQARRRVPTLPPRPPAMITAEVPGRTAQQEAARPNETEANYGTFDRREFPLMTEKSVGYWWHKRLTETGIVSATQTQKRYDRIPSDPISPHTLFLTGKLRDHVAVTGLGRITLNEYLGMSLK